MFLSIHPSGPLRTNAILFGGDGIGAVIDPAMGSADPILLEAEANGLKIEKILLTHSHWDHIVDLHKLQAKTGAFVYVHPLDAANVEAPGSDGLPAIPIAPVQPDFLLEDGEIIKVGALQLEVIHTPGHSLGCVCFYLEKEGILFAGDTLFKGSLGRLDLPTGHPEKMWPSLKRLAKLPSKTRVIPGHGPETEIGKENWLEKAEEFFG